MFQEHLITVSFPTGASFASKQYCAASVNSSGQAIVATSGKNMVGVVQNTPDNSTDLTAAVGLFGKTKVTLGGTVTVGEQLQIGSNGTFVVLSSGTAVAIALEAGGSGDIVTALIQPNNGALS